MSVNAISSHTSKLKLELKHKDHNSRYLEIFLSIGWGQQLEGIHKKSHDLSYVLKLLSDTIKDAHKQQTSDEHLIFLLFCSNSTFFAYFPNFSLFFSESLCTKIYHLCYVKQWEYITLGYTVLNHRGRGVLKRSSGDFKNRIAKAQGVFINLKKVWKNRKKSLETKIRILEATMMIVVKYGSEAWVLQKADEGL